MTRSETQYEAVIVGGGPSGIAAACQLQRQLHLTKLKIFERGAQFGGAWYHNRYAGAGCDIPPRLYSFSFYQKKSWNDFMAKQPEMEAYLQDAARAHALERFAEFNTDVYAAEWVEECTHWRVKYRSVDGERHGVVTARVLVNGSGALSVPRDCDVPGWERFEGALFHSARWDAGVDLTGKDVVVLGNGCSGTQVVPNIAKRVRSLTQVCRAKHWYAPTPENPFAGSTFGWLQRHVPGWIQFERLIFTLFLDVHFIQAWNKEGKGARDRFAANSALYVRTVAPERYHHMLMPTQHELKVACKRRVFDDAYIPALNLPNVDLTTDQAVEITEHAVVLQSGRRLKADVIILASGFKTGETNVQMRVTGRNGRELNAVWAKNGAPQAYRTVLCHDFPNLALLWGPGSVTGHYSAIFTIESSVRFMCSLFKPLFLAGPSSVPALERSAGRTVDVKADAQHKEDVMVQTQMRDLIYTSGCKGWYTNAQGRVSTLYPGFQLTFAWRSDHPIAADLEYTGFGKTRPSRYWSYWQQLASWLRLGDVPEYRAEKLRSRAWLFKYLLDPVGNALGRVGIWWLMILVWVADKGLFYTRGAKDFEKVKERYLEAK
ncbi:related to putative monooxygenase [Sporisorium reilianum SRZ2]|uniref:Related to putative monooxygenase n=1 Tax=Sporisorium reilianum (strain SRZ2) TaxID=999809 RepID=E7A3D6_SPORE|nr:related to putative monooxygenase [Sporisorium reilianum SRZ2]